MKLNEYVRDTPNSSQVCYVWNNIKRYYCMQRNNIS